MQERSSDNPLNGYSFSYISKNEFESIFKHVRRERRKRRDEKLWERFQMKKKEKQARPSAPVEEQGLADCKASPHLDSAELAACKHCPKSSAPAVAYSNVQKSEQFPTCFGHHQGVDSCLSPEPPVMSISHQIISPERQDCGCHHVGYMSTQCESPKEPLSGSKVQQSENKLFEVTNFDQEFKRVEELRDKIVFTLKSIEKALSQGNYQTLDEEEMMRNKMRTAEFAARFKRNYHYQITRQVNEIRKLSSNESWKKSNFPSSGKKFKSSHQVAVQALQAVEKHLRTTNDGSSHLWLQDFLGSVCEMEELFSAVFHSDDKEEQIAVKTACTSIASQLNTMVIRYKPDVKKKKKKHTVKRNEAKDNLWMYRTHKDWKTKASELARAKLSKFNKKKVEISDDDRIEEKIMPPAPALDNLQDLKMEVKQREGASLRKHVRSIKEDQVRTMMEIVPDATDSDHDEEKGDKEEHSKEIHHSPKKSPDHRPEAVRKAGDISSMNELTQPRKLGPSNVGYICLRSDETRPPKPSVEPEVADMSDKQKYKLPQVNSATNYRKALQSYQRKRRWYNPNIICSIDQMTDQIYEELISSVASEINIDHIISNLIELEVRR